MLNSKCFHFTALSGFHSLASLVTLVGYLVSIFYSLRWFNVSRGSADERTCIHTASQLLLLNPTACFLFRLKLQRSDASIYDIFVKLLLVSYSCCSISTCNRSALAFCALQFLLRAQETTMFKLLLNHIEKSCYIVAEQSIIRRSIFQTDFSNVRVAQCCICPNMHCPWINLRVVCGTRTSPLIIVYLHCLTSISFCDAHIQYSVTHVFTVQKLAVKYIPSYVSVHL